MKSFWFIMFRLAIIILPALIFIQGCSSGNKLSDYKDPVKFYERLNDKTEGKKTEITTNSGSVIAAPNGVAVKNDTLYIRLKEQPATAELVSLKLTSNIYTNNVDSLLNKNTITLPVSEVNRVRYKSRLMALPAGIIGGFLGGMVVSALIQASFTSRIVPDFGSSGSGNTSGLMGGAVIGAALGGMISLVIGFNYNFYFY